MNRIAKHALLVLLALLPALPLRAQYVADEVLRVVPPVAGLTLGAIGVSAEHPFRERAAVMATSGIVVAGSVFALKNIVRRERPDGAGMDSFPSGHTAIAFWGAEIVREEYGWAWGAGAYAVAGGVAALRLYHQKHWATDVLAGAAIGVLGARIGYLLLPWERRIFGWDESAPAIIPTYVPEAGAVQLTISQRF